MKDLSTLVSYKICKICNIQKPIFEYYIVNKYHQNFCKSCKAIKRKESDKKYAQSEKGKEIKRKKAKKYNNSVKGRMTIKNYYENNKDYYCALSSKKRAKKLNATPSWLTEEDYIKIEELYIIAKMFQIYTGLKYHVDHIIPLNGKTVCGLHVPWNLQILEASENLKKKNKLLEEFENAIRQG